MHYKIGDSASNRRLVDLFDLRIDDDNSDSGSYSSLIEIEYWPAGAREPALRLNRRVCLEIIYQLTEFLLIAVDCKVEENGKVSSIRVGIDAGEFHYLTPLLLVATLRAGLTFVPLKCTSHRSDSSVFSLCKRLGIQLYAAWRYAESSAIESTVQVIRADFQNDTEGISASLYLHRLVGQLTNNANQRVPDCCPVYCIRTSGSTGVPKLVEVPDSCIVPNIVSLADDVMRLKPNSRLLWSSPLDFDPSLIEIFCARYAGCCLVVTAERMKPTEVLASLTHIQTTPSLLLSMKKVIERENLQLLECLMLGGEPCPAWPVLRPLLSGCRADQLVVVNLYGVTELSVWATMHRLERNQDNQFVPLGQPLANTWLRLTDPDTCQPLAEIVNASEGWKLIDEPGAHLKSCSIVLEGELWMSRAGTLCRVESNNLDGDENRENVWHRSGDLVRLDVTTGQLVFLGRSDHKIKRYGVFLYPEAFDKLLFSGLAVTGGPIVQAHTVVEPDTNFIVCLARPLENSRHNAETSIQQLSFMATVNQRVQLDSNLAGGRRCLPDELLILRQDDEFVLTPNGKVDSLATLRRERQRRRSSIRDNFVDLVQGLWALHTGSVPTPETSSRTFAQCGGDSLGAVRLAARLNLMPFVEVLSGWTIDELVNRALASVSALLSEQSMLRVDTKKHSPSSINEADLAWRLHLGSCVDAGAFATSDAIFAAGFDGIVASASPIDGRLRWSRRLLAGGKVDTALIGSPDARLLVIVINIDEGCQIHFLSEADGSSQWHLSFPSRIRRPPTKVVWNADLLIVGCHDATLHSLSFSKRRRVGIVLRLPPRSGPVADLLSIDNGTLVACLSGRLMRVCWPAEQGLCWRIDLGSACLHRPCLALASTVAIVGLADCYIISVSMETGQCLWRCKLESIPAPVVSACGLIIVACGNGQLRCLEPSSGQSLCCADLDGSIVSQPLVLNDQTNSALLAVSNTDGCVTLLRLSTTSQSTAGTSEKVTNADMTSSEMPLVVQAVDCVRSMEPSISSVIVLSIWSYHLPGPCFAPPMVWSGSRSDSRRFLLIGCRDDHLYCLRLPDNKE